jgi:hypothetical protein
MFILQWKNNLFEAQDLGLELSLQKNQAKKINMFKVSMMRVLHPTIFSKWWKYCISTPF